MFNKSCPLIKVTIRNTRLKTDYQATSQPHILHRLKFDLPKNTDTSLQKNPIKPEKPTGSDFFQKKPGFFQTLSYTGFMTLLLLCEIVQLTSNMVTLFRLF